MDATPLLLVLAAVGFCVSAAYLLEARFRRPRQQPITLTRVSRMSAADLAYEPDSVPPGFQYVGHVEVTPPHVHPQDVLPGTPEGTVIRCDGCGAELIALKSGRVQLGGPVLSWQQHGPLPSFEDPAVVGLTGDLS
jgi:hypothetical protein